MKWVIRIVGGLFGVLLLGVVVLFAMGQRANANRTHASIELNAPPDRVWAWVADPPRLKEWVSWTLDVRREGGPETGVGSKWVAVMRDENNGGQSMEIHSTVAEYGPPARLRLALAAPEGFDGDQTYQVTDLGGGRSRLDITMTYHFSMWFARLMEPLITPMAEKKLARDLARLKSLVEAGK